MQTTFFKNVLEGISDDDAHKRLGTKANHVAWLAGSAVQQRFEIAKLLGVEVQQTADDLFKNQKGIQDNVTYPPLATFKSDWEIITPILSEALIHTTDEKLDTILQMPGFEMKTFDMVAFSVYREANLIGQIALWRRLLGYEAMKYM